MKNSLLSLSPSDDLRMLAETTFFTEADGDPVAVENPDGKGEVLLVCEHASRRLPQRYGTLGLSRLQSGLGLPIDSLLVDHLFHLPNSYPLP